MSKEQREQIHAEGFLVEFLRDLQKRMCCLEDIAVLDDEITMFMEMRSGK